MKGWRDFWRHQASFFKTNRIRVEDGQWREMTPEEVEQFDAAFERVDQAFAEVDKAFAAMRRTKL